MPKKKRLAKLISRPFKNIQNMKVFGCTRILTKMYQAEGTAYAIGSCLAWAWKGALLYFCSHLMSFDQVSIQVGAKPASPQRQQVAGE
jgi:hypothetical protein